MKVNIFEMEETRQRMRIWDEMPIGLTKMVMLSDVAFRRTEKGVLPEFVNQFILTDLFLSSLTSPSLRRPVLPSIATLVNPLSTLYTLATRRQR